MNWTCDETRRHLLRQQELSEAALDHLTQCAVCQEMMDLPSAIELDSGSSAGALDIGSLLSQTQLQLSQERGLHAWLRSRKTPFRIALGVGVALVPAAAQLALSRRTDLGDYPLSRLLLAVALYLVIVDFAAKTLLSPLYRPRSRWALWLAVIASFGLPMVVAALAPAYSQQLESHGPVQYSFLYQAWVCLRYGTLLSLPAVLLLFALDRQVAQGRRFPMLAAGLGGVAGNFALLLHCPNEQPTHQLLGHATVGLLLLACIGVGIVIARFRSRKTSATRRRMNSGNPPSQRPSPTKAPSPVSHNFMTDFNSQAPRDTWSLGAWPKS